MAENVKKFLDLAGLTTYDGKIKQYANTVATTEAGKVNTNIRKDYKVKDVDTTVNDKVSLTLNTETGKVGVTVNAAVVKDSAYDTVKANANNSAAAWGKFLEGTTDLYPNNVTPGLKDLATDENARSYADTAKNDAIKKAGELDAALEGKITTAYQGADDAVKSTLIGADGNASDADTIYGAKKYADEKAAAAKAAADGAQSTADAAKAAAKVADDKAVAAQGTADTALANAATADRKAVVAQNTADEIKNTIIPGLQTSITSNTNLINTTKTELVGTEGQDGTTIYGAKKYAKDLADGLSTRINSIVAGGVAFKGVVAEMPSKPQNGDLVIIGKEGGITVGDITYKKDYEYIYSEGAWYELGDSDKNAQAIAAVKATADANATAIQRVENEYKTADTNIKQSIDTVSKAAVKSIAVTDNSDYVSVTAGEKDNNGNVTLTVTDNIAATFDTITSVNSKISTAKNELKGDANTDTKDSATIVGAKKYTDEAVKILGDSFVAITADEINALFA